MLILLTTVIVVVNKDKLNIIDSDTYSRVEEYLMQRYDDDYYKILDFKAIKIGGFYLLVTELFEDDLSLPKFSGSDEEILKQSIDYLKQFDYDYSQNNPSKLLKTGKGNCQAMSIVLKSLLERNGVICNVMISDNHAYNVIVMDDKVYTVDITNGYIDLTGGI